MITILKKSIFGVIFLVLWALVTVFTISAFRSGTDVLGFDLTALIDLIIFSLIFNLAILCLAIFMVLANDWRYTLVVTILAAGLSLLLTPSYGVILAVGLMLVGIIGQLQANHSLKSYLNFSGNAVVGPTFRLSIFIMTIVVSGAFLMAQLTDAQKNKFVIPDSVIDLSLNLANVDQVPAPQAQTPQLSIPDNQLAMLRQNPQLLQQAGLDPSILDNFNQSPTTTINNAFREQIRQSVKAQAEQLIAPYQGYIPYILAGLFLVSLLSLSSLLGLIMVLITWIIFWLLEWSSLIRFEKEMREIKKLVV